MTEDTRCCGTGTCMINVDGLCWCGQRWIGDEMCAPVSAASPPPAPEEKGLEAAEIEANAPPEAPQSRS